MMTRDQINWSRKYEKGYPEDEAELMEDVQKLTRADRAFAIEEASFEDSRRYYCLIEL